MREDDNRAGGLGRAITDTFLEPKSDVKALWEQLTCRGTNRKKEL